MEGALTLGDFEGLCTTHKPPAAAKGGSLTIVGTGIYEGQVTLEALFAMRSATKLLYGGPESTWTARLNKTAEEIMMIYRAPKRNRRAFYHATVEHILRYVRAGEDVCAAFYGCCSVAFHRKSPAGRRG
jgi:hypothetical protein